MKTMLLTRLALVGGLALFIHPTPAQTWQTVDDFQYAPGQSSLALALALDPAGNLFVVGEGLDTSNANGLFHALIQKSADGGATWSSADDFAAPGIAYYGIAADAGGNLYAAGGNIGGLKEWFVRQSIDGGSTWNTVDAFSSGIRANGVATDSAGNVFAVGTAAAITSITTNKNGSTTTNSTSPWIVRKGTNLGSSWSTVDTFVPNGGGVPNAVFCHPTQGIFVTGQTGGPAGVWTTRRSLDSGATWATVDSAIYGRAQAIGADPSGNIYAVGNSGHSWIVRKSSNGGASWLIVDDFLPQYSIHPPRSAYYAWAYGFAADSQGNLFVVGYLEPSSSSARQWIVRENLGGTGTWQTVDTFQYASGKEGWAIAAAADASGHVYVGGRAQDANGTTHWIVRKN